MSVNGRLSIRCRRHAAILRVAAAAPHRDFWRRRKAPSLELSNYIVPPHKSWGRRMSTAAEIGRPRRNFYRRAAGDATTSFDAKLRRTATGSGFRQVCPWRRRPPVLANAQADATWVRIYRPDSNPIERKFQCLL